MIVLIVFIGSMSTYRKVRWYHSYKGNDSIMGSYCTELLDGSLLIAQAVQDGIEYILWKGENRKEIMVPIQGTSLLK